VEPNLDADRVNDQGRRLLEKLGPYDWREEFRGHATPTLLLPGLEDPVDEDRDWATGEDPADDIDGDGRILRMRVRDPDGTYIADPAEPRLLRVADRAKGEAGIWRLLWEGIDNDGDGEINEDGAGGAQPARNFPHAYEEHRDEAGLYTLSEPCARAIAEYLIGHPRTAQVLLFSSFDSTTVEPKTGKPRRGWPRSRQASSIPMTRLPSSSSPAPPARPSA
ncbi:MAG: hypothetical protein ACE5GW_10700, partial [Planctomycetota bacterium]